MEPLYRTPDVRVNHSGSLNVYASYVQTYDTDQYCKNYIRKTSKYSHAHI